MFFTSLVGGAKGEEVNLFFTFAFATQKLGGGKEDLSSLTVI